MGIRIPNLAVLLLSLGVGALTTYLEKHGCGGHLHLHRRILRHADPVAVEAP